MTKLLTIIKHKRLTIQFGLVRNTIHFSRHQIYNEGRGEARGRRECPAPPCFLNYSLFFLFKKDFMFYYLIGHSLSADESALSSGHALTCPNLGHWFQSEPEPKPSAFWLLFCVSSIFLLRKPKRFPSFSQSVFISRFLIYLSRPHFHLAAEQQQQTGVCGFFVPMPATRSL